MGVAAMLHYYTGLSVVCILINVVYVHSPGAPPTPVYTPPDALSWSHNDTAVAFYFVLILEADDDVIAAVYNTSDTTVSLAGLQDGRQYRARVRGVSGMGVEGEWSEFALFSIQSPSQGTRMASHLAPPGTLTTPPVTLTTSPPPSIGSIGIEVDIDGYSVEGMAVGITLGVLVCVVAVVMVVGLVAVCIRLRKTHSE